MEKRKRKKQKMSGLFLRGFLLIFLGAVGFGIVQLRLQYQQLQEEQLLLAAQIEAEKQTQEDLAFQKEYYRSDSYIEKIAREQLGMIKSNEILFVNRGE